MESSHVSLGGVCSEVAHRFSVAPGALTPVAKKGSAAVCVSALDLKNNNQTCVRTGKKGAVAFGSSPLEGDDAFEVRIEEVAHQWAGSLRSVQVNR